MEAREVSSATGDWRRKTYSYDHRGRVEGVLNESASSTPTDTFTYAEPGWLTNESHDTGGSNRSIDYSYDSAGNRTKWVETLGGAPVATKNFSYAYGNILASVDGNAVTWNGLGETTTDHGLRCAGLDGDRCRPFAARTVSVLGPL